MLRDADGAGGVEDLERERGVRALPVDAQAADVLVRVCGYDDERVAELAATGAFGPTTHVAG